MKRLLQRIDDGRFYKCPQTWTGNFAEAFDFPNAVSAVKCCMFEKLPAAYYVLKFGNKGYDVQIVCDCASHSSENQAPGPPVRDDLETSRFGSGFTPGDASNEMREEKAHWGHSFNTRGMWINNQGQG